MIYAWDGNVWSIWVYITYSPVTTYDKLNGFGGILHLHFCAGYNIEEMFDDYFDYESESGSEVEIIIMIRIVELILY